MNIGILGGGIGGLASAIGLQQAGFDVAVYERHSQPSQIGAGIMCWPNASFVLDQLGVLDKVAKVSGLISQMNRYTCEGEAIGSLDINQLNQLMGYPSYSILRKDLMNILTQRVLELGIAIHYQHQVSELSDKGTSKVCVRFSNGKTIEPDIIIGADGRMNSLSRQYVHGDNSPIYQGLINWIGVVEFKSDVFTELSVSDYWGVGERFGIVPVSARKAYWAGGTVAENIAKPEAKFYKAELNSTFKHWPTPIGRIIDEIPLQQINKIYLHDHEPIPRWHKNNLVLLGDAAHSPLPTSGQGACQALEDAWHLANVLTKHTNDLTKVFASFTELRQAKTAGITMGGRQLAASIFNQDPTFCAQRNQTSKDADYQSVVEGMAKGWASGLPMDV